LKYKLGKVMGSTNKNIDLNCNQTLIYCGSNQNVIQLQKQTITIINEFLIFM
jgi:hypothetical protein